MAGNGTKKVVEFFNGSMHIKAVLMEEAPDEKTLCCMCETPVHGLPFYTTEPHIFDVHLRCVKNCSFFFHGQEKSSSPAPGNHRHYKHDKQLAGFQYPWQPQPNVNDQYGSVSHVQPMSFSFHPPPFYHHPYYPQSPNPYFYPCYQQPPNPYLYPCYPQPPNPNPYLYPCYPQPPNPNPNPNPYPNPNLFFPYVPVSQSNTYRPPANNFINQHADVPRPTNWGTSAAVMLGSSALGAFLEAFFDSILPT